MRFRTGASALNCVPVRRRWRWLGSLGALSSKRKFYHSWDLKAKICKGLQQIRLYRQAFGVVNLNGPLFTCG